VQADRIKRSKPKARPGGKQPRGGRNRLGGLFRGFAERGIAVLVIEHNMQLMMTLCDELYVLDSGELIAHGSPEQVRTDSKVVEAYLGVELC